MLLDFEEIVLILAFITLIENEKIYLKKQETTKSNNFEILKNMLASYSLIIRYLSILKYGDVYGHTLFF